MWAPVPFVSIARLRRVGVLVSTASVAIKRVVYTMVWSTFRTMWMKRDSALLVPSTRSGQFSKSMHDVHRILERRTCRQLCGCLSHDLFIEFVLDGVEGDAIHVLWEIHDRDSYVPVVDEIKRKIRESQGYEAHREIEQVNDGAGQSHTPLALQ